MDSELCVGYGATRSLLQVRSGSDFRRDHAAGEGPARYAPSATTRTPEDHLSNLWALGTVWAQSKVAVKAAYL
jgi:hypothetical protein